jgi:hypothetical protein
LLAALSSQRKRLNHKSNREPERKENGYFPVPLHWAEQRNRYWTHKESDLYEGIFSASDFCVLKALLERVSIAAVVIVAHRVVASLALSQ